AVIPPHEPRGSIRSGRCGTTDARRTSGTPGPPPEISVRRRGSISRRGALQEGAQHTAARGMAQLAQRLRLDLTAALPGHGEPLPDVLGRVLAAVPQTEALLDHLLLARRERLQDGLGLLLQIEVDHRLGRRDHASILDEVAQVAVLLLADRGLETDRLL